MRLVTTLAAVLATTTATHALAGVFEPGQAVVVSENTRELLSFDRDGDLDQRLDAKLDNNLRGVAIGPDGRICVSYENRIAVHDEDYGPLFEIDTKFLFSKRPAFGPNGHLFVPASQGILEYDRAGDFVRSLAASQGVGGEIAFGPEGDIYTTSLTGIQVFSPNGEHLRSITNAALTAPTGICFDEQGLLWVSQAITINFALPALLQFDRLGGLLDQYTYGDTALRYADDLAIGGDGNFHVVDYIENQVYRIARDGTILGTYGGNTNMSYAGQIVFAPYLLEGKVSGRVRRMNLDDEKVKDSVYVSVDPGSRQVMVLLKNSDAELLELLGIEAMTFQGVGAFEEADDKKRYFHGVEMTTIPGRPSVASCAIEVQGDVDDDDAYPCYEVEKGKGTLHFASAMGVLIGEIKFDD